MRAPFPLLLLAALAAVPLTNAHVTGEYGIPKTYCENLVGDTGTHDYGPVAVSTFAFAPTDGSLGDCDGNGSILDEDYHREFAQGGAVLLTCDFACGWTGFGDGAALCWGQPADHVAGTSISVFDRALGPVAFTIGTDNFGGSGNCGDNLIDNMQSCFATCVPVIPPGADGSYQIFVTGTLGHVYN